MAIDNFKMRQVACKIININNTSQKEFCSPTFQIEAIRQRALKKDTISRLWREVELLKKISHV